MIDEKVQAALKEHMRKLASEGGKASSAKLTDRQRIKRARDAGKASGKARKAKARTSKEQV